MKSPKFSGTRNPRHLRAIEALRNRPMPREELDKRAGCSNSPELIAELRRRGLECPCERVECYDRDGKTVRRGIYHLTPRDHRAISRWIANRTK